MGRLVSTFIPTTHVYLSSSAGFFEASPKKIIFRAAITLVRFSIY
jgi:hypothetical protein